MKIELGPNVVWLLWLIFLMFFCIGILAVVY